MANPKVAIDEAGEAIAVWASGSGETARIRYAVRPSGGDFGGAKTISDPAANFHSFPALDVAPDGRAVVAYARLLGGVSGISYAVRPPGGDFGEASAMVGDPGTTLNQAPQVHMDAAGGALANWVSTGVGGTFVRYADLAAGAGEFTPVQAIEKGSGASADVNASGAAVLVWGPISSSEDIRYSSRPPGGAFGGPQTLAEPDNPLGPKVSVAPDGSAVVAWSALVAPDEFVRWAAAPAGGTLGPPQPLSAEEGVLADLKTSAQGTALLLWVDAGSFPFHLRAALRPAGGTFGPSPLLPGPPQGANLFGVHGAFDQEGNAAAIWNGWDPTSASPHDVPLLAAGLDFAGPRIETMSVPERARDDRAVDLSMTTFDVWSPVTATGFDFGDGARAPGPVATHRFLAGLRTVTGSATDAVGNTSTATRTVEVSDVSRPVISRLRVRPRKLSIRPRGARASRRFGGRIRFRLSERARVRFAVQRPRRGVRVRVGSRRRCLPRTARNLRRGHGRCTRFSREFGFARANRRAGTNALPFTGRHRGRRLSAGRHRLVAIAIDGAGLRSKPARTFFRVRNR